MRRPSLLVLLSSLLLMGTALAQGALPRTPNPTEAWQQFLAEHGPRWTAEWSPATGTPKAIYGQGFRLQDAPIRQLEEAREHAQALLVRYAALLGRGASSFDEQLANRTGPLFSFVYRQSYRGLEVIGGRADLRIHECGGVSMLGSEAFPIPARFGIEPEVQLETARDTAHRLHEAPLPQAGDPRAADRLVIWADPTLQRASPVRLAWEIDIDHRAGETVGKCYIDALTGTELGYRNDWHECGFCACHPAAASQSAGASQTATAPLQAVAIPAGPPQGPQLAAISGTVMAWTNPGLRPIDTPQNIPVAGVLVSVQGGGSGYTDRTGAFSIPHTGTTAVPVVVEFKGRRIADVVPQQGTKMRTQVNVTPGTPTTIQIYTSSVAQFDVAQANVYWATDDVNEWLRGVNGTIPSNIDSMVGNTSLPQTCNAYYTRNTINFYHAGGSCNMTAFSTVIYHEWGHGIDDSYGGISQTDGLSEGWGDIIATYRTGQPVVGDHFRTNGGIVRTALNTLTYPQSGAVHTQGSTWMGFAWDLRTNLISSLGQTQGVQVAERIVLQSLAANARNQPDAMREVFLIDDDDNNLNNGTPHYTELEKAALKRRIPYPKRQSQNPGTWVAYGQGCLGSGTVPAVCDALNDSGANANLTTRANLTYALRVTASKPLQLNGFELNTSVSGGGTLPIRIYDADTSGRPNQLLASGTMTVGATNGWYVGNLTQPVLIGQGTTFFIAFANGATPIQASVTTGTIVSYYRNDGANGAWNGPLSGFPWAYRLRCVSSSRVAPSLVNAGVPELGKSFELQLGLAAKNAAAILFLGGSKSQWQTVPLPLDLTAAGATGCSLLASMELLFPTLTNGAGTATLQIPVPNDPRLENNLFYSQVLVIDGQANQLGLVLTNAGTAKIGKE